MLKRLLIMMTFAACMAFQPVLADTEAPVKKITEIINNNIDNIQANLSSSIIEGQTITDDSVVGLTPTATYV